MADINRAKSIVRKITFPEISNGLTQLEENHSSSTLYKDLMLHEGVLVNDAVTPSIYKLVSSVLSKLKTSWDCCSCFIYNSPEIQATCYTESSKSCIIKFSSGLINLLEPDELQFVTGHELGHFLGNHQFAGLTDKKPETLYYSRLCEIVADRVGFLATGKIDICLKSILKTASGLDARHLRFDFPSFLRQIKQLSENSTVEEAFSTHPSLLLRCRALLWFSMLCPDPEGIEHISDKQIRDVNQKVISDLDKYLNRNINHHKNTLTSELKVWVFASSIAKAGVFKKNAQDIVKTKLGTKTLESLKSFLALHSHGELVSEIESKLNHSLSRLQNDFPSSAKEIMTSLEHEAQELD